MFIVPYYYIMDVGDPAKTWAVMDESNTEAKAKEYCELILKKGYSKCEVFKDVQEGLYRCLCDMKTTEVKREMVP